MPSAAGFVNRGYSRGDEPARNEAWRQVVRVQGHRFDLGGLLRYD